MASYLVTSPLEATELIEHYNSVPQAGQAGTMIGYTRNWYALRRDSGDWIFGPAHHVGWVGNHEAAKEDEKAEGRKIEATLSEWFEVVGEGHPLAAEVRAALKRFVASKGKTVHRLARIHVLKGDVPAEIPSRSKGPDESWRITSSAGVLSGKPCIRGLRIRVADILEMLALGAGRADILEDYPYLEDGDISAALEYAAGAVNHRLIRAA